MINNTKPATAFFNGYIPPYEDKPITQQFKKITAKDLKYEHKKQQIRAKHLSPKEQDKMLYLLTLSSHFLEGFIDCLDEIENLGCLGKEHDLIRVREKLLNAQSFFLKEAIDKGEETFMARQEQQKDIEALIKSLTELNLEQLHAVMNFASNVKHQKSKKIVEQ